MDRAAPGSRPVAATASVWDAGRRALTAGMLLTVAASAFESLAVATILPQATREIGGLSAYGWAFSSFMLSNLVGISAAGRAGDRRGPAVPFVCGAALFVLGLLVAGAAPTMGALIAGRFVQGFGAGAISAMSLVAVARAYPQEVKPRILALLSTAWVAPGLIGPAIAGAIAETVGWRWVFFALTPLTAIGALMAAPPLRRIATLEPSADPDRTPTALALALGVGLLLVGLGLRRAVFSAALVATGLVLATRSFVALVPAGTLRARRGMPAAVAVMGLVSFAFFGAEAFVPLALSDVRGAALTLVGVPLTCGTLAWTAGAWVQAREAPHRSRRRLIAAGLVLLGIGIGLMALNLSPQTPLALASLAWAMGGMGMGIVYSTASLVVLETAAPNEAGTASASLQLSSVLGIALGTGLGGEVLAATTALGQPTAAAIAAVYAIALAGVGLGLVAARRVPARAPAP